MSVSIERTGIADHIVARLEQEIETVQAHFAAPVGTNAMPMFDGQKSRHKRDSNSGAKIQRR